MVVGICAYYLAVEYQDIIETLELAYTVFSAGVIIPIIAGFYKDKTGINPMGALGGMIFGGVSGLILAMEDLREWSGVDEGDFAEYFDHPPILIGLGFCVLGIVLFNWLGSGKEKK